MFKFQFDYKFVQGVYSTLMSGNTVFVTITGVKVLAIAILLISWYNKYFKTLDELDPSKKNPPVTPGDLIRGVILIAVIGGYDQLLNLMDGLLGSIESQYLSAGVTSKPIGIGDEQMAETTASTVVWDVMKAIGNELLEILNDPSYIILKLGEAIAWLCDLIVYGLYVAERFFFLGVLRVFGGLTIAFFAIEKLQKWFWSWLGLYFAVYLAIIPFFLINAFTNAIYQAAKIPAQGVGTDLFVTLLLIFVVILKVRLFKRSNEIIMKIFN